MFRKSLKFLLAQPPPFRISRVPLGPILRRDVGIAAFELTNCSRSGGLTIFSFLTTAVNLDLDKIMCSPAWTERRLPKMPLLGCGALAADEKKVQVAPVVDHTFDGSIENSTKLIGTHRPYSKGHRALQVDAIVFNKKTSTVRAYEIKQDG